MIITSTFAVEPRATIAGRDRYPFGAAVLLDGRKSASDRPLRWRLKGSDAPFELADAPDGIKNAFFKMISPEPGTYRVQLVAIGIPENGKADDIDADVDEHIFIVDESSNPQPNPGPAPGPAPGPRPAAGTPPALGYDYAASLTLGAASTLETAAVGPWNTTGELTALMQKNFTQECINAFNPTAGQLTATFGAAAEQPIPEPSKVPIRDFLKGVAQGIRMRVK